MFEFFLKNWLLEAIELLAGCLTSMTLHTSCVQDADRSITSSQPDIAKIWKKIKLHYPLSKLFSTETNSTENDIFDWVENLDPRNTNNKVKMYV